MAIKTPTSRTPDSQWEPVASARRQHGVADARPRQRSPYAASALRDFDGLRRYFAQDVQLAKALEWDAATVAEWRQHEVVRPQRAKVEQVGLLGQLCQETRPYLRRDMDVGEWLNAPLPNLRGSTPAEWVRRSGRSGLRQLVYGMVDWMPRVPEGDLKPIDEQQALARLDEAAKTDEGARELKRMLGRR